MVRSKQKCGGMVPLVTGTFFAEYFVGLMFEFISMFIQSELGSFSKFGAWLLCLCLAGFGSVVLGT